LSHPSPVVVVVIVVDFFAYGLVTTTSILLIICLFYRLTRRNQYLTPRLAGKLVIMVWYFSRIPKATMASGRSLPLDNISNWIVQFYGWLWRLSMPWGLGKPKPHGATLLQLFFPRIPTRESIQFHHLQSYIATKEDEGTSPEPLSFHPVPVELSGVPPSTTSMICPPPPRHRRKASELLTAWVKELLRLEDVPAALLGECPRLPLFSLT
jgi:hypothetical protein